MSAGRIILSRNFQIASAATWSNTSNQFDTACSRQDFSGWRAHTEHSAYPYNCIKAILSKISFSAQLPVSFCDYYWLQFLSVFLTNEKKDFRQWFKTKRHIHPWYFNLNLYEVCLGVKLVIFCHRLFITLRTRPLQGKVLVSTTRTCVSIHISVQCLVRVALAHTRSLPLLYPSKSTWH